MAKMRRALVRAVKNLAKAAASWATGTEATEEGADEPLTTEIGGDPAVDAAGAHDPVSGDAGDEGRPVNRGVVVDEGDEENRRPIMSGIGSALADKAAELSAMTAGWEPNSMLEWVHLVDSLSDVLGHVADMVGHIYSGAGDLPLEPAAVEAISLIEQVLVASVTTAQEAAATVRTVHTTDLERLANPRNNEQKWDVVANAGQSA